MLKTVNLNSETHGDYSQRILGLVAIPVIDLIRLNFTNLKIIITRISPIDIAVIRYRETLSKRLLSLKINFNSIRFWIHTKIDVSSFTFN